MGDKDNIKYVPGTGAKGRAPSFDAATRFIHRLEDQRFKKLPEKPDIKPAICISRKVGISAVQIADLVAQELHYHVFDRQVLDQIASSDELGEKTLRYFDQYFPGIINELAKLPLGKKSLIFSDYGRRLVSTIYSLASADSAIFIGRGCHLILPQNSIMAVRLIATLNYRIKRLANLMNISETDAERQLIEFDTEQQFFFSLDCAWDGRRGVPARGIFPRPL